jgi:hypothetical protein
MEIMPEKRLAQENTDAKRRLKKRFGEVSREARRGLCVFQGPA